MKKLINIIKLFIILIKIYYDENREKILNLIRAVQSYEEDYSFRIDNTVAFIAVFTTKDKIIVNFITSSPGILIGKSGTNYEKIKTFLNNTFDSKKVEVQIIEHYATMKTFAWLKHIRTK